MAGRARALRPEAGGRPGGAGGMAGRARARGAPPALGALPCASTAGHKVFSAPSGRAPRGARSRAVAPCAALGAARRAGTSRRPAPRRAANATRAAPKMVFERFTERAIKAVMEGQSEAKTMGRPEVLPEHLLLGVIAEDARFNQGQGPAAGGFYGAAQIMLESSREAALVVLGGVTSKKSPKPQASGGGEVPFSLTSKRVFEAALGEAERLGHNFISPEHLVLALAAGPAQGTLDVLGAAGAELREAAERRLEQQSVGEGAAQGAQKGAGARRARRAARRASPGTTPWRTSAGTSPRRPRTT